MHEDTEYAPTCGLNVVIGRDIRRKSMDGKVLTRNVVLFTECASDKCNHTGELSVEQLRDNGMSGCHKCGDIMILSQECAVRN